LTCSRTPAFVTPKIFAANNAALNGSSTTAGAIPEGIRRDEYTSAPPNESEEGGQAMTGALTEPSVNPLKALLRPATVM
jgi:hypothetical protein